MEKQQTHIDDFFKDELGSYTEAPPPAAWDALQKKLTIYPPQPPRLAYHWLGYSAMCVLILSLGLSLARKVNVDADFLNSSSTQKNTTIISQPVAANALATNIPSTTNTPSTNNTLSTSAPAQLSQNDNSTTTTGTPAKNTGNNPAKTRQPIATENNQSNTSTSSNHDGKHNKGSKLLAANHSKNRKPGNATQNIILAATYEPATKSSGKPSNENDNVAINNTIIPQADKSKKEDNKTTTQKEDKKQQPADEKQTPPKHKNKPSFNRFEAGVKGGFETSADGGNTAHKYLGSVYLQYNLSPKFSIMTQPAIKFANVNNTSLDHPTSYYRENADSNHVDGTPYPVLLGGTTIIGYRTDYQYSQTHDSIVKSNNTGGKYAEYEIPLLLKFSFNKSFSLYGGVNIDYSKQPGVTENTFTQKNISIGKDTSIFTPIYGTVTAPYTSSVITYPATSDITNYRGYTVSTAATFRLGYMFGISYEYSDRWLLDVLMQQTTAKSNVQGPNNIDINTPLSSTYLRFTIGYKLIK